MKRCLTILLALVLALGLAAPALAETELQDGLTEITAHVVAVLELPDDYTDFTGDRMDGPRPGWHLYWSKDGGENVNVECRDDGLLTEVYIWRGAERTDRFYGFDPAFPDLREDEARQEAERLLSRLMGPGESARIDDTSVSLSSDGTYTFTGRVRMNGLESPVSFSLTLDAAGVTSYYRSDSYRGYVGELPAGRTAVPKAQAAAALKDAAALELYYVSDGDQTRLRYVPAGPYTTVDAQTGETVDMEALYASFDASPGVNTAYAIEEPAAMETSMDSGAGRALTETELTSIARYADVLSQEALDTALRSLGDLGLAEDFTLKNCSYRMDGAEGVTASLRYSCEMTADRLFGYSMEEFWQHLDWGDTPTVEKYIDVDAKTGRLLNVYTGYSLWQREEGPTADPGAAEAFLTQIADPERGAECALCTLPGYASDEGFFFARTHDGYFCPEDGFRIRLNPAEGTVDEYSFVWDDERVFASSTGIADAAAALTAYTDALNVTLGYVAWPEGIDYDDPVLYAWADWGYTYVESLRLVWYYGNTGEVSGVDALTGEAITAARDGGFAYTDLAGVPEREAIEALAAAGIGLPGAEFRPESALTQRDAARLLLSAAGYADAADWDDEDLRGSAVWQGLVTADKWDPDAELTREGYVRWVLGPSRYGDAAALPGIGFETVARALGMTDGPLTGEPCTRAEAAALLYAFMKR